MAAPIALTDEQMRMVTAHARMLHHTLRGDFLRVLAATLRDEPDLMLACGRAVRLIQGAHREAAS